MIGTILLTIFVFVAYIVSLYFTLLYWIFPHQRVWVTKSVSLFSGGFFRITERRMAIFTIGFPVTALLLGIFMLISLISYMKTFVCVVIEGVVYLWKLVLFGKEKNSRNEKENSKV